MLANTKHHHISIKLPPLVMSQLFPWLSLVAIIWLQAMSGTNTDFPAYSSRLKCRLDITQAQLNNLAVASDAGKLFGFLSGIAATRLPLWSVLAFGSAIGSVGYGVQYLFLANKITTLSYPLYLFLQLLAGNSICWINTACYVSSMRKFPNDHGIVVGLATSYTGLSAKLYIALAQVIIGTNFTSKSVYLLLNSVVMVLLVVVTAPLLVESKPAMSGNGRGLFSVFVIAGVTGVYAVVQTLVPMLGGSVVGPATLLVMVGLVAGVPLVRGFEIVRSRERVTVNAVDDLEVRVSGAAMEVEGGGEVSVAAEAMEEEGGGEVRVAAEAMEVEGSEEREVGKSVGSEHGVRKLVKSVEFWLYFMVYLCGGTMGLVYANNLGQVASSREVQEAVLLSVSSTFGFFGKLSAAPLSLFTRSKYMISRPAFVAILMVPMSASFFLLLIPTKVCLFFSTAIIGVCTGAITSIAVSMTADLFGPESFSVNHNIVVANIPIGSFIFGYLAAVFYDREGGSGGRGLCVGMHCYQTTFIIWGSICTFGTLLSFALYFRTRKALTSSTT